MAILGNLFRESTASIKAVVVEGVGDSLATNGRTVRFPDVASLCLQINTLMQRSFIAAAVAVVACYAFVDAYIAAGVAVIYVFIQGIGSYVTLRAVSSASSGSRLLVFLGYCLSGALVAMSRMELSVAAGDDVHWFIRVKTGPTNPISIIGAVAFFVLSSLALIAAQSECFTVSRPNATAIKTPIQCAVYQSVEQSQNNQEHDESSSPIGESKVIRILFLAGSPSNTLPIAQDEEIRAIRRQDPFQRTPR